MALYFISYDLRKQRNYQQLYDKLGEFKAVRILESTWCFNRKDTTPAGLRDFFKKFIDQDDGIIVSEVEKWASFKTKGTPKDL